MIKNTKMTEKVLGATAIILALSFATPAFAETSLNTTAKVGVSTSKTEVRADAKAAVTAKKMDTAKTKASAEIDARIDTINRLLARIQTLMHLSSDQKTALQATLQTQISALTDLKTKIVADTTGDILKTDAKSITESYRIYALVLPQAQILIAADQAIAVADALNAVGIKLSARINNMQTGTDMTKMQTALTELNAKIADAKVQAQAAIDMIATLTPDNGDKVKLTANTAALKAARVKIKAATEDLKVARKDAGIIVTGLKISTKDLKTETKVKVQ